MPHGFPGVDSSMNRPNSGWKIGSLSSLVAYLRMPVTFHMKNLPVLAMFSSDAPTSLGELLILRQRIQDVRLSEREPDSFSVIIEADD